MHVGFLMEPELILENHGISNLAILGNILHSRVWSLCNQLLQFSMDLFETMYMSCVNNENMHVGF